ncbi:hypothetical protein VLK81_06175 [Citroniella saccharovorans]|uniref:Uncharacterized protein n=1 Tax=Citroniella saccharovorans TaxID=2053367 RepID=A0AAW9MXJ2_9FIRM|nr:hypothetical protein [Citroniella saccharovorans]MEB3429598.1 hypothetical protein [Citroniella saccharovorans]
MTFDPSSGGKGNKLKTANPALYKINSKNKLYKKLPLEKFTLTNIKHDIKHKIKFVNIPAIDTTKNPNFLGLNLLKSTGTGFAQPNLKIYREINPGKERCFKGFIDNLPMSFAVVSLNIKAAYPCATS